jgi:phage tail-like protein
VSNENTLAPLHVFRFHVDFHEHPGYPKIGRTPLCSGSFAECTGLEATMEPKVIKEGGRNYGALQRSGPVTFATVILKRGLTTTRDLWKWFELVTGGKYAYRLSATINVYDVSGVARVAWRLERALPIKFKAPDLSGRGTEVGIEELHLVHEGLRLTAASRPRLP